MRAIRLHAFGPPENLTYEEVPDPEPGVDQIRIRVEAAGVHLIDTWLRSGEYQGGPMPELPTVPGFEVAGVVDAVGEGALSHWVGRRVVAFHRASGVPGDKAELGMMPGGYAELAVTAADRVHEVSSGLDAAAAVAMIATGRTAALVLSVANLTPDDVVLVPSAAGGLGSLFVQEAVALGATVVGLAGGVEKVERVRALGASIAADYLDNGWPARVREQLGDREVSVVLDGVGGEPGRAALEMLGTGGRFHMFGWSSGTAAEVTSADIKSKALAVSWATGPHLIQRYQGGLRALESFALDRAGLGRWTPLVTPFPLEKAAEAHAALENRRTVGKTVLLP